jgi:CheY-like chemotaxis protein
VNDLGARILVVDDDDAIRETVGELLDLEGYGVDTAANGAVAWNKLEDGLQPDVIILDVMMPVLDGYGFREKQTHSRHADIPVVIISANGSLAPELLPGGRLAGCAFLPKPFELGRVLSEIEKCLER